MYGTCKSGTTVHTISEMGFIKDKVHQKERRLNYLVLPQEGVPIIVRIKQVVSVSTVAVPGCYFSCFSRTLYFPAGAASAALVRGSGTPGPGVVVFICRVVIRLVVVVTHIT